MLLSALSLTAILVGAPNLASAEAASGRQEADALAASADPVRPVAGVKFRPRDKAVRSWLNAMVPCPGQGYTMYDYLRVETDDARRRGLSETFVLTQAQGLVGVARFLTRINGALLSGTPKMVVFFYSFDFPWSDLQAQVPANVPAQDPIAHIINNMVPVCRQLRDGQARHLVQSHIVY